MNFLAHQYLSFNNHPVMAGNFIADTIKGKELDQFPLKVAEGIEIHRAIDSFTDSHEKVLVTRKRLYPYFGKYAAVVQDVYYDHFLANLWHEYHQTELFDFTQDVYATLSEYSHLFNARAQRIYHYMSTQNWLYAYKSTEGLDKALKGLSRRAKFNSNMENGIEPLIKNYNELLQDFRSFFPQLEEYISNNFFNKTF